MSHPPLRAFAGAHKGGDLLTLWVDQRLGSVLAWGAARAGLTPNQVSGLGGLVALATTAVCLLLRDGVAAAAVAVVGFHLSYGLDCADGQLARVTQQSSPLGAVVDLCLDYLSHACVGVVVAWHVAEASPDWALLAALVGASTLAFGSFLSGVESGHLGRPTYDRTPGLIAAVARAAQDWGLHLTVLGASLALPGELAAVLLLGTSMIAVVFTPRRLRSR